MEFYRAKDSASFDYTPWYRVKNSYIVGVIPSNTKAKLCQSTLVEIYKLLYYLYSFFSLYKCVSRTLDKLGYHSNVCSKSAKST